MKIILINNTVTLIDEKGSTHFNSNLSEPQVKELNKLILEYQMEPTEEKEKRMIEIVNPKYLKKKEEEKEVKKEIEKQREVKAEFNNELLVNTDFNKYFGTDEENRVFYKGFKNTENVFLPDELLNHIKAVIKEGGDILPFVRFWELCLANPDPNARQGLFKFVRKQRLIITPNGFIVCFRNAKIVEQKEEKDTKKVEFILKEILRLRKQRANLSKYSFGIDDKGEFHTLDHRTKKWSEWPHVNEGTYKEMSEKYESGTESHVILTDAHTGKMRFGLGSVVSIPRKDCDADPKVECSRGLHIGSKNFLTNHGSGYGQATLLCLVNPSKVVSVPYADAHKMRVCEYKVIGVYNSLSDIKELDESELRVFENEYIDYQINEIKTLLNNKTFVKEDYSSDADLFLRYAKITEAITIKESNLKVTPEELENLRMRVTRKTDKN